jgi:hypothetical protein
MPTSRSCHFSRGPRRPRSRPRWQGPQGPQRGPQGSQQGLRPRPTAPAGWGSPATESAALCGGDPGGALLSISLNFTYNKAGAWTVRSCPLTAPPAVPLPVSPTDPPAAPLPAPLPAPPPTRR